MGDGQDPVAGVLWPGNFNNHNVPNLLASFTLLAFCTCYEFQFIFLASIIIKCYQSQPSSHIHGAFLTNWATQDLLIRTSMQCFCTVLANVQRAWYKSTVDHSINPRPTFQHNNYWFIQKFLCRQVSHDGWAYQEMYKYTLKVKVRTLYQVLFPTMIHFWWEFFVIMGWCIRELLGGLHVCQGEHLSVELLAVLIGSYMVLSLLYAESNNNHQNVWNIFFFKIDGFLMLQRD